MDKSFLIELTHLWDDCDYALREYVSEPPTDELITSTEEELSYKLLAFYITMMKARNRSIPINTCFLQTWLHPGLRIILPSQGYWVNFNIM